MTVENFFQNRMDSFCKNFVQNRMDSFCKNWKKSKMAVFNHFWTLFGFVSQIPIIHRTLIWCRMTVENFVRIVRRVWENRKMAVFGHFWANFGYVSHIPVIRFGRHCTRRGPFGCRMTVQTFMKIVWTVIEEFEIFIEMSGEKKTTRLHK